MLSLFSSNQASPPSFIGSFPVRSVGTPRLDADIAIIAKKALQPLTQKSWFSFFKPSLTENEQTALNPAKEAVEKNTVIEQLAKDYGGSSEEAVENFLEIFCSTSVNLNEEFENITKVMTSLYNKLKQETGFHSDAIKIMKSMCSEVSEDAVKGLKDRCLQCRMRISSLSGDSPSLSELRVNVTQRKVERVFRARFVETNDGTLITTEKPMSYTATVQLGPKDLELRGQIDDSFEEQKDNTITELAKSLQNSSRLSHSIIFPDGTELLSIENKEKVSRSSITVGQIEDNLESAFKKLRKSFGREKALTVLKELHQGGVVDAINQIAENTGKVFSLTETGEVIARIASNGDVEITRMLEGKLIDQHYPETNQEKIKVLVVTTITGDNEPSSRVDYVVDEELSHSIIFPDETKLFFSSEKEGEERDVSPLAVVDLQLPGSERALLEKDLGREKALTVLKELFQGGVVDAINQITEHTGKGFRGTQKGEVSARIASNGDVEITRMLEGKLINKDHPETNQEEIKVRVVTTITEYNEPSSRVDYVLDLEQFVSFNKSSKSQDGKLEDLERQVAEAEAGSEKKEELLEELVAKRLDQLQVDFRDPPGDDRKHTIVYKGERVNIYNKIMDGLELDYNTELTADQRILYDKKCLEVLKEEYIAIKKACDGDGLAAIKLLGSCAQTGLADFATNLLPITHPLIVSSKSNTFELDVEGRKINRNFTFKLYATEEKYTSVDEITTKIITSPLEPEKAREVQLFSCVANPFFQLVTSKKAMSSELEGQSEVPPSPEDQKKSLIKKVLADCTRTKRNYGYPGTDFAIEDYHKIIDADGEAITIEKKAKVDCGQRSGEAFNKKCKEIIETQFTKATESLGLKEAIELFEMLTPEGQKRSMRGLIKEEIEGASGTFRFGLGNPSAVSININKRSADILFEDKADYISTSRVQKVAFEGRAEINFLERERLLAIYHPTKTLGALEKKLSEET